MEEIEVKEDIVIEKLIYEVRGKQVMFDTDLAKLYKTETKRINEAVYRNKVKFPERFCFRITEKEFYFLKSQFATSKGGARKGHTVFTEQGVAMLATVLKTPIATKVSVSIMDAFVKMRKYISTNIMEQKYINDLVLEDHNKIKVLESTFKTFEENKKTNEIYFNGQIFDAYYKIQEIFKEAKDSLVIIDSYADSTILDIIKRLNVEVTVITKPDNLLTKQDIEKYNKQYHNLKVVFDNTFHDRYFILDERKVYHCGTSINRIGYKTFSITKFGDNDICELLIDRVNRVIA